MAFWKRDINYYIKSAFIEGNNANISLLEDSIVEHYIRMYISENDEKLLELILKKEDISQRDLNEFLDDWDIEKEGARKALLLSGFMKKHPELSYPAYVKPRLDGLLKFYKFKNLKTLSHFKKCCSALREGGVDVLIMKGGALMHCCPDIPRIIGDIDILVPFKQYEKAKNIALPMYQKYTEYHHSVDLYDSDSDFTVLDIHKKLDMQTKKEVLLNKELFKRAHKEKVFGVEGICVPTIEDLVFILLINMCKNLMRNDSYNILGSIVDCETLINLKPDFNWDIVRNNAIKTQTEPQISLVMKFLNKFLSVKLPDMFTEAFYKRSLLCIYKEVFLGEMHTESHELNIKNINSWSSLQYYIKFRVLYTLFKRKFVRKNAYFAEKILKNQGFIK